jgi:hypothetical protein
MATHGIAYGQLRQNRCVRVLGRGRIRIKTATLGQRAAFWAGPQNANAIARLPCPTMAPHIRRVDLLEGF